MQNLSSYQRSACNWHVMNGNYTLAYAYSIASWFLRLKEVHLRWYELSALCSRDLVFTSYASQDIQKRYYYEDVKWYATSAHSSPKRYETLRTWEKQIQINSTLCKQHVLTGEWLVSNSGVTECSLQLESTDWESVQNPFSSQRLIYTCESYCTRIWNRERNNLFDKTFEKKKMN